MVDYPPALSRVVTVTQYIQTLNTFTPVSVRVCVCVCVCVCVLGKHLREEDKAGSRFEISLSNNLS